jgi:hypothetical protein
MSLKVSRFIAFFGTVVFAFVFHFLYQIFPNFLFSIFFPVNESVWEHMKMLYSSIVFYGIIDYFLGKKFDINYKNFIMNVFILSFSSIIIYLALFLPIYYSIGESMFMSIGIMILTFAIIYVMSYFILSTNEKGLDYIWFSLIVGGYIFFIYLTYFPLHQQLFFDTKDEIYGIKKRN